MDDRCDGYDNTISGLLRKRGELFGEVQRLRDRIAEIRNDVEALDRTLASFGFKGDLDAQMPRQKREVIFGQGEFTRALMRELRDADGPMTSRELANNVLALRKRRRDPTACWFASWNWASPGLVAAARTGQAEALSPGRIG